MSLRRFHNCNLLEMDHFRQHGVEDEPNSAAVRETPFAPVDDGVLRRVSRMLRPAPASLYLQSGDAVHLANGGGRYCFPTTHSALSAAPIMKGSSIPPALHPVSCTT